MKLLNSCVRSAIGTECRVSAAAPFPSSAAPHVCACMCARACVRLLSVLRASGYVGMTVVAASQAWVL